MAWTDERVGKLRKLYSLGWSASKIAVALGCVSRNAIIGKANRLGLPAAKKESCRKPKVTRKVGDPKPVASVPRPVPEVPEIIPEPVAKRLSVFELTTQTCKWPIGDPRGGEFYFCGCPTGLKRVYCSHHEQVAYKPAVVRKRRSRSISPTY